jgi:hypothetical protein
MMYSPISASALALAALFKLFLTPIHVWSEVKLCCHDYFCNQWSNWKCNTTTWHNIMVTYFLWSLTFNSHFVGEGMVRDPLTHIPILLKRVTFRHPLCRTPVYLYVFPKGWHVSHPLLTIPM